MRRYQREAAELYQLTLKQLNLPKNASKEDFESMFLKDILAKLREEILELEYELSLPIDQINCERVRAETGDCGAMLAGVLAFINDR